MQQMLAKTFGAVAALLAVSTSLLGCGGGETPCESSIRQANEDIMRMELEMRPCHTDPDPEQSMGCQCNLLGGMVEVCQRFLGSCDDEALTRVWTQMRETYQGHMQQLGCGNEALMTLPPFFLAGTEMGGGFTPGLQASTAKVPALQASNSSSVATRIVTDARPLVDTVQASSLPSSNGEKLTTVTSTQQGAAGSAGATSNFLSPTAYIVTGGGGGITSEGLPDHGGAGAAAPVAAAGVHFYPRTAVTGGGGGITSEGLPHHRGAEAGAAAAEAAAGVHFYPRTTATQRGTQVQQVMVKWQQGVGGIAVMLLMVLVSIAVTVAFLARRRQAPSDVEIADIGRP